MSHLTKEDLPLLHNRLAEKDIIASGFKKVISWGCSKPDQQTFKQHIESKHGNALGKNDKKFVSSNSAKLNAIDCSKYDVTFLYSLIPLVCNNIAVLGTKEHSDKLKDPMSVESLLKEAKECRNRITHEYDAAASSGELNNLSKTLENLLKEAAKKYKKNQVTLDEAVSAQRRVFISIGKKCFSTEWVSDFIKKKIHEEAMNELKANWEVANEGLNLPLNSGKTFKRKSVYSNLKMTIPIRNIQNENKEISMQELIEDSSYRFKLIQGPPGAGKTTMCQRLMDICLEQQQVDLIVNLACRTSTQETLSGLLKEQNPKTLCFLAEKDVSEVASQLIILFLIDGYDEVNEKSFILLMDIINKSKSCPRWSFIISSRPQACNELNNELRLRKITSVAIITLELIVSVEEKKKFLSKFMLESAIEGAKEKDIDKLPAEVLNILNTPSLLCIFYALLQRRDGDISFFNNEGRLFSIMLEEVKKDMERKIKDSCPSDRNPRNTAGKVLESLFELSLKILDSNQYFLTAEIYEKFIDKLITEVSKDINFENVLSCVFALENGCYNFWHTSFQEYLSAKYIALKLEEKRSNAFLTATNFSQSVAKFFAKERSICLPWHSNMMQLYLAEVIIRGFQMDPSSRNRDNTIFQIIDKISGAANLKSLDR